VCGVGRWMGHDCTFSGLIVQIFKPEPVCYLT